MQGKALLELKEGVSLMDQGVGDNDLIRLEAQVSNERGRGEEGRGSLRERGHYRRK